MVTFIDDHREDTGRANLRRLPIAPSTYYACKARASDPGLRSARSISDEALQPEIERVWRETAASTAQRKYGSSWAGKALRRPLHGGPPDARHGATWGCAGPPGWHDRACRSCRASAGSGRAQLHRRAPDQLWVADLTYVATWRGFVYVAFVIDVFSRRIVGWRVSNSLKADLALDALDRPSTTGRSATSRSCITAIGACNICRFATRIALPKRVSSRRWVAVAIPMTTHR